MFRVLQTNWVFNKKLNLFTIYEWIKYFMNTFHDFELKNILNTCDIIKHIFLDDFIECFKNKPAKRCSTKH